MRKQIEEIKKEYADVQSELNAEENFSDPKKMATLGKKQTELEPIMDAIRQYEEIEKNMRGNAEIINGKDDPEMKELAMEENTDLAQKKEALEKELEKMLLPKDPHDGKNIIVEIRAGAGGDESALFAADLFRMYARYAEKNGWQTAVVDSHPSDLGGYKEIVFEINGDDVYGKMKYESGVHRVQRVPETEKMGRVHTSTATVAVLPEAEEIDLKIDPKELRVDTFCSSGPGGQSVNTTYSAIRITHLPTGLIVSCQDEKSQIKNKEKAMKVLRSRLLQMEEEKRAKEMGATRKSQIGTGDRSEKIRTYNFPQDRITDHRIGLTLHSILRFMDGEIEEMINGLQQEDLRLKMGKNS